MISTLAQVSFFLFVLRSANAYLVDPPTTALPDTNELCSAWQVAENDWTDCNNVANANGLPIVLVARWNPSCKSAANFVSGNSYCIEVNFGVPEPIPTPTPISSAASMPSNGIATPSPIQKGMTSSCNKFYLVSSGDSCYDIAASNAVSLESFYLWNPAIGSDCVALWAKTYVCVGVIGGSTPSLTPTPSATTARPTSTSTGNGITTPSPVQPSMVASCNKFYFVKSGDSCYDIAASNNISLDHFYTFNPYIQPDCSRLWAGYNVCVGVIGGATPTPIPTPTPARPTSTSGGNGIATPSPVQPSMVANCAAFYLVKAGDGCYDIAVANGISTEQFYDWNPYVNTNCSRLWSGYNVCVRTIGFIPPMSSTFKIVATSTKPASSTPTPVQPGMVNNCKKFYKVQAGDGCWAIADTNKIFLDDFYRWNPAVKTDCSALWGQYYVCVGL